MLIPQLVESGKMFGALESYKSADFWREHPIIRFDTLVGFGEYAVTAVFKVNPADFPYHTFISVADQAEFDNYVSRCKALSFYDTGVTAVCGGKLITLSTCEYSAQGNRLVVAAKKFTPRLG
jgi:sortase B